MISFELIQNNLLSPMVLAFFLGLFAVWVKSDLRLPEGFYNVLSYYLLLALGIKGGFSLSQSSFAVVIIPCIASLILGCFLPVLAFFIARVMGKLKRTDAAALAAHYGSVSVITFMASLTFIEATQFPVDGFMTALVAILEIPGIVVALLLAQKGQSSYDDALKPMSLFKRVKIILVSKSILLLLGGLFIGLLSSAKGIQKISPFFVDPFQGILVLFLLDMGLVAGQRLKDIGILKGFITFYAIFIPIVNAFIAIVIGHLIGLSVGSTVTFAAMAASASYIAAPAAVRMSLPQANPAVYLTAAIVVTFPFNLTIGIPLYFAFTKWWFSLFVN